MQPSWGGGLGRSRGCTVWLNLHQRLISKVHLTTGWVRYDDYVTLEDLFWSKFKKEAGGLSDEEIKTIEAARIVGLLLSRGFTSRLSKATRRQYLSGMMKVEHTTCVTWMGCCSIRPRNL